MMTDGISTVIDRHGLAQIVGGSADHRVPASCDGSQLDQRDP